MRRAMICQRDEAGDSGKSFLFPSGERVAHGGAGVRASEGRIHELKCCGSVAHPMKRATEAL